MGVGREVGQCFCSRSSPWPLSSPKQHAPPSPPQQGARGENEVTHFKKQGQGEVQVARRENQEGSPLKPSLSALGPLEAAADHGHSAKKRLLGYHKSEIAFSCSSLKVHPNGALGNHGQ